MNLHTGRVFLCAVLLLALTVGGAAAEQAATTTVDAKYAGLSWGPLGRAALADLPEGTLLTAGSLKITKAELADEISKAPSAIQSQLNTYGFFMLEQTVTSKLLSFEAKAWADKAKITKEPGELIGAYLESAVPEIKVSDEEVEKLWKESESLLGSYTLEQQKAEVVKFLEEKKRGEAIENYVKSIGGRHKISISAKWMDAEHKKWMKNPVEQARKSGKPSLLDFGADWCMPCKVMAPAIDAIREDYKDRVNVVFLNTDKEPILATHYGANPIPLLLFYDKDGKEVFRHSGVLDKKAIEEKLNALLL